MRPDDRPRFRDDARDDDLDGERDGDDRGHRDAGDRPDPVPDRDTPLSRLDKALLNILVKDGRASFADMARTLGISRAHARARVQALQALQAAGIIELFTAVINPEKLGQAHSTFLDVQVAPGALQAMAQELADCPEVVSLYIMSDLRSLHVHALTDGVASFEAFARRRLFNRPEILSLDCKTLLTRVKNRRGGARL